MRAATRRWLLPREAPRAGAWAAYTEAHRVREFLGSLDSDRGRRRRASARREHAAVDCGSAGSAGSAAKLEGLASAPGAFEVGRGGLRGRANLAARRRSGLRRRATAGVSVRSPGCNECAGSRAGRCGAGAVGRIRCRASLCRAVTSASRWQLKFCCWSTAARLGTSAGLCRDSGAGWRNGICPQAGRVQR